MLLALQAFALFFALILLVVWVSADDRDPTSDSCYARLRSGSQSLFSQLQEKDFVIPEPQRKPQQSMKEFYEQQAQITRQMYMGSKLQFRQASVGSVMQDGFHADLPPNAKWEAGRIVMGENVRQQVKDAIQTVQIPPPANR